MNALRHIFMLLLTLTLTLSMPGWAAKEAGVAGEEQGPAAAAGKEEAKEDECPATFGPIIGDTAVPIAKGKFAIQPTWGLFFVTDAFSSSWRRVSPGGNYTGFNQLVKVSYGLWDNLEVNVVMNTYEHAWARNVNEPGPKGERAADFGSIGNTLLTFKYQFIQEGPTVPNVTGVLSTAFPTGHYRHLNPGRLGTDEIGQGGYQIFVGCNLQKYLQPFIVYGNVWYGMATSYSADGQNAAGNPAQVRVHPRDSVNANLAAELPLGGKWVALLELTSFWDGGRLFGHKSNVPPAARLSILPGIEYMATDKFSLALGVNIDLIGKNGDAAVNPLLSMVYCF